jgi:hypothetical protein
MVLMDAVKETCHLRLVCVINHRICDLISIYCLVQTYTIISKYMYSESLACEFKYGLQIIFQLHFRFHINTGYVYCSRLITA